jgi:hypothetical protein
MLDRDRRYPEVGMGTILVPSEADGVVTIDSLDCTLRTKSV